MIEQVNLYLLMAKLSQTSLHFFHRKATNGDIGPGQSVELHPKWKEVCDVLQ